MPAMTAKAANRLPRTPHRGRNKPSTLPRPNRTAIACPRRYLCKKYGREYRGSGLIKLGEDPILRNKRSRKRKRPAMSRPFVKTWFRLREGRGSVARDDRAAPVEAVVHAGLDDVVVGGEGAGRHQSGGRREV